MKKQLFNLEADYTRLRGLEPDYAEQLMRSDAPWAAEDLEEYEEELTVLRSGEAVFFWESPPAASPEEAANMARQAASEMAPEPGQEILAAFLHITAKHEWNLEAIEGIADTIQECFDLETKDLDFRFSYGYGDEETHFILFTAEGNGHDDLCDIGHSRPL